MRDMVEAYDLGPGRDAQSKRVQDDFPEYTVRSEPQVRWRRFGFDHAGICYGFETSLNGDRSRIVINGKASLELPQAVWGALLEAVTLQRTVTAPFSTERLSSDGAPAPPDHAGAAWDKTEDDQLRVAWTSGASVRELATLHQRSRGAITARLIKLRLTDPAADPGSCSGAVPTSVTGGLELSTPV